MINDLLNKLEEANRIFGAGIATGVQNHADVELCRKQVDDQIKCHIYGMAWLKNLNQAYADEISALRAEIDELKGLLEE